ncbi:metal-dependent hydrolase [Marinobacter sp.]|uniref:metal-dependent hydrolase n=1 Tax=Marinobacter sp. TaxID=50741 RepID=UPI003A95A8E6
MTICPFYQLHPSFLFSGLKFPDGEQQFINVVRLYRDRIEDPKLKAEIRGFIGQEALHSREHKDYNEALKARVMTLTGWIAVFASIWSLRTWMGGLNFLWGKPGILRQCLPDFLAYFRKDFHSW